MWVLLLGLTTQWWSANQLFPPLEIKTPCVLGYSSNPMATETGEEPLLLLFKKLQNGGPFGRLEMAIMISQPVLPSTGNQDS